MYIIKITILGTKVINRILVLKALTTRDLDNSGNIYITSQKSPSLSNGSWSYYHKEIVKIPFYARNDQSQWENVNLSAFGGLDISGEHSEVEKYPNH